MRVIVDSNIIMSALIRDKKTREILTSPLIEFYTIDFTISEIRKHKELILEKSGLSEEELEVMLALIMENVLVVGRNEIKSKLKEAINLMKEIGIKDSPILACALAIPNDGLWTQDKHFQKQNKVKIILTPTLLKII